MSQPVKEKEERALLFFGLLNSITMTNSFKSQPDNLNILQTTRFQLNFARLKDMSFFCQTAVLPGVSTNPAVFPTPFVDLQVPGDKLVYDPFTVTFIMDEDLAAWREIHAWMRGYTFPTDFQEYRDLGKRNALAVNDKQPQYSDGSLTVFTNAWVPNLRYKFYGMFPTALSGVTMATSDTPDTTPICDCTFSYQYFDIEKL